MQAAWVQDLLALLLPVAFLFGARRMGRRATKRHPYGLHQSMEVAHLVASMALVTVDHPAIGLMSVFGLEIWQGWLMIGFMALGIAPPLILGWKKLGPARSCITRACTPTAR